MSEARALLPEVDTTESQGLPQQHTQRRFPFATALVTLAVLTLGSLALARVAGKEPRALVRGPLGDEITELEENACDRYPYLKFGVPNAILNNNLANKGPDQNGEGIVYKTINLGTGAGSELEKEIYMTVNATSSDYQPFSPRLNGMQGKYGSINLNSGSSVDLHFNFYDAETMEKLTLSEFAITWFDLDTGSAGKSAEFVTIGGFQSYHLTTFTEVKAEKQPDGRTKFSGTTTGTGEDNPKDPMFLTEQQENRAVTLLYGPTSSLDVTIGATAGSGPRFFTFVGRPSLLCAVTVQQNFKPPLPDLTFAPPMEQGIMSKEGETFVSFAVKKGDTVKEGDLIATTQKQGKAPTEHRAPFDGTVTQIQDKLKSGDELDLRLSDKILAVVKRPSFKPLLQNKEEGVVGGGPGQEAELPSHAVFKRYLVAVGDSVSEGTPIAVVEKHQGGEEVQVKATGYGTVKERQEAMKEGTLLQSVPDGNLVTLGPYEALGPLGEDNVASGKVPEGEEGLTFEKFHVKKGDVVKVGDPIATVKDQDGHKKVILATHEGVITDLQKLEPGSPIDRVEDRNLCTTGKFAPLPGVAPVDVGFREVGVQVPDMDCTFKDWKVEEGQYVQTGDPIAEVQLPSSSGDDHGRRMASAIFIVPSPGNGWVSYMADLKPGQRISEQAANPTIAKVNLGWPWWLTLLLVLGALFCCFACLYRVMQKQPAYKAMPPEAATALEPQGLRLDFADQGTVRTVYAKYKPLGIKHNHTAPIVAQDFTINSYAKQALGVQPDWKLTRIGDEELDESHDFDAVNEKLSEHMKDFPIWPLPLEFRKNPEDAETHVYKFTERPLGMEFSNVAPIKVDRVYKRSPAAMQNVEVGWFLTKIGDFDVHENPNFREVLKHLKEGVQGLADEGNRYTRTSTL